MNKQKFSLLFIYLAVFINGGLILVIEIAGAKILTPYFGGTLHVWGAMISVTLAALAIGYFAGGKLADKVGKTAMLPSAIIVGSMLAVLGTIFSKHILDWTKDFSLEMGTLVSSVIIFIPSLIVLATVSPMGIKLILRNFEKVGSTSGTVFAISTIGSVLGAIIAAFYLIPWLGSKESIFFSSIVTIAFTIVLYLVIIKGIKRKVAVLAGILCIVAVLSFCFVQSTQPQILPKESARKPIEQLFKGEGFYGAVEVFEDPFHRYLLVDGILQTKMLIDFDLFFERGSFLRAGNNIELLPYLHPEGKSALFIGLGAGNQPTFFKNNYDWEIDAIEIDPIIAELAKKYFGFEGDVIIEDGRTYLNRTDKIYDFIITDVFAGEQLPEHLFSVEAFERVFKALDEFGVAEYTFIGDLNGDALKSLLFTARQVFPYANVYPGRGGAMGVHSIILRKVPIEILIYNSDWFRLGLKQPEPFEISEEEILKATLLTDAKNPINKIRLEEARRWRQISNKLFNPSIR